MKKCIQMLKQFYNSPKKYIVTVVLAIIVIGLGYSSMQGSSKRSKLNYSQNLEEKALEVRDESLNLRQLAFYVAYEEQQVQKQAQIYDSNDTNKYWNLHIDGEFIKVAARNAAIQMAIHDQIFAQMAKENAVELNEEELRLVDQAVEDFWSDLTDYDGQVAMGIEKQDIYDTMSIAALAQKYQRIYAESNRCDYEDYDFTTDKYEALRDSVEYEIVEKIWSRVDFGNVTLNH